MFVKATALTNTDAKLQRPESTGSHQEPGCVHTESEEALLVMLPVQEQLDICRAQAVKELSMTDLSSTYPALRIALSQTAHLRLGYRAAAGKAGTASNAPLRRPACPQPPKKPL